jgi:oligopeptide/dipeptide ABC transporter ATP-binding protein
MTAPLLAAAGLSVDMPTPAGRVRIVDDIDFSIGVGERVALVGESGSGKSVTAQALMRLNRKAIVSGRIAFDGRDLVTLSEREMTALRGSALGMVFQDPMSSLDPLMTIGDQVAEVLRIRGVSARDARARALAVLDELRVERARERLDAYPHEFSGGMRQRVVLAMALVGEPRLVIADEPTTALDVRVQEQVLDLLDEVSAARGLSVLLITHDLGIVAGFADRVMVMYSGRIVEDADVGQVFARPRHPYTAGLIAAVPRIDRTLDRLAAVPGAPPPPRARPTGCAFHPRCAERLERCDRNRPEVVPLGAGRVACHKATAAPIEPAAPAGARAARGEGAR